MKDWVDTTLLDDISAGDKGFRNQLLQMIHDELVVEIPMMQENYVNHDLKEVHRISHQLKTSIGYVFKGPIVEDMLLIEQTSKLGHSNDSVSGAILRLNESLPAMKDLLWEMMKG